LLTKEASATRETGWFFRL